MGTVAVRWILRRARLVIAASDFLASEALRLGAREVRVVPSGVALPDAVGEPDEPPHVLFAGRLSPEKDQGLPGSDPASIPRVIVGAGPVRVPESVGVVPPSEIGRYYERAAVVCVPSQREGYGMVAREAMAYGRPVVATPIGGLRDAVEHEVTGLLAAPDALRGAIELLSKTHRRGHVLVQLHASGRAENGLPLQRRRHCCGCTARQYRRAPCARDGNRLCAIIGARCPYRAYRNSTSRFSFVRKQRYRFWLTSRLRKSPTSVAGRARSPGYSSTVDSMSLPSTSPKRMSASFSIGILMFRPFALMPSAFPSGTRPSMRLSAWMSLNTWSMTPEPLRSFAASCVTEASSSFGPQ